LNCDFCRKKVNKSRSLRLKRREIFVCEECQSYILLNGLGLEGGIMVVPVNTFSLEKALKDRIYVRPWRKRAKHQPFIAFYHKGAIRYIGKVKNIHLKVDRKSLRKILPEEGWGNKKFYTVYELEYVDELKYPIVRENCPPVQNKIRVSFRKFLKARSIRDLFNVNIIERSN